MQLTDAIALIEGGFYTQREKAVWADLGCGAGLFTYALARLLAPENVIYAIDKSTVALTPFPVPDSITIRQRLLDFTKEAGGLPNLDGIIMANSLHYVRDKPAFIRLWQKLVKPNGCFVIVEYDTEGANPWVPFPVSFNSLNDLFKTAGYAHIVKIGSRPSQYRNGDLYAALIT